MVGNENVCTYWMALRRSSMSQSTEVSSGAGVNAGAGAGVGAQSGGGSSSRERRRDRSRSQNNKSPGYRHRTSAADERTRRLTADDCRSADEPTRTAAPRFSPTSPRLSQPRPVPHSFSSLPVALCPLSFLSERDEQPFVVGRDTTFCGHLRAQRTPDRWPPRVRKRIRCARPASSSSHYAKPNETIEPDREKRTQVVIPDAATIITYLKIKWSISRGK